MKKILIILMFSFINLIAQDYYTIIDNNGKINKHYYIEQNEKIYKNNSIYLKLNKNLSLDNLQILIYDIIKQNSISDFQVKSIERPFEKFNNQLLRNNNLTKIINFKFTSNTNSWIISKILQESGEFSYVIPERIYRLSSINSNDPFNDKTEYLDSLKASEIWEFVKGDSSISIGIVDSGVMINHEDLVNTIKINYNEIPDDGKDNDNNGFVDDYFGWDFVGDVSATELFNGNLKPDNDIIPKNKYNNHGTHVAGIACAETNNNNGVSSLGYALSYIPVKVSADDISQLNYVEKPFEGILYALNRGADVINCSWLDDDYNPLAQDIVNEVLSRGSIVVCAAGNSALDNYNYPFFSPASLHNVISVGASSIDNTPASFSHFGWNVDFFAPGQSIYSTIMENKYDFKSGTSMSTPIVASLVGLMKKLHPNWNFKQIELQLRANASKMPNFSESDTTKYWGTINPIATLENNFKQNKNNPGLSINDYYFDNDAEINEINMDYGLNLELKNYLADATNISCQLIPLVDYIKLDKNEFLLNSLANDESSKLKLNVKLSSATPYFEGSIPILVVMKAENYRNLEIINIPYQIETSTKFLAAQYFADYLDNDWLYAKSPSKYSLWLIGKKYTNGRGIIFSFGKSFDVTYTTKNPTAIYPFDDKIALVALKSGNISENAEIALTKNGGLSFSTIDKPFSEIYDIHFFDDKNGVVFGSNNASYFGIKTSKDGGNSWNFHPLITAETNERIINQTFKNKKTLFITNNNNLYYSDSLSSEYLKLDKYNFSGSPVQILLSENKTIITLTKKDNSTIVVYSLDLGKNWFNKQINLTSKIIKSFFLLNTEIIYSLLENGEIIYTDDYFETYNYILNKETKFGKLYLGTEYVDSCGIRIWQVNNNLYLSDVSNAYKNASKIFEIAGQNSLKFDTLKIEESSAPQIIFSSNTGEGLVQINDYIFSENSNNSFKIDEYFPKYISPCQLYAAKIIFAPTTSGWHYDTLSISSNSNRGDIKYFLSGYAYDPSSVSDIDFDRLVISPNPATDYITIIVKTSDVSRVEIYDVIGVLKQTTPSTWQPPLQGWNLKIGVSNLTPGIYFLKIIGSNGACSIVEKFVKL